MEDWDAQKTLDLYIHDYLVRKNMHSVAETFAKEAVFSPKDVSLNPPDGFLTEWWSIFWDMYTSAIAKNPEQGEMLVSKVTQMFGSMGSNNHPNMPMPMPMPDMSFIMQNVNPVVRIPGLPSMLQSIIPPLMSRPDIGALNQNPSTSTMPRLEPNFGSLIRNPSTSTMPRLEQNLGSFIQNPSTSTMPRLEQIPNGRGPASVLDFSARQGQGMTNYLEAIMREQEIHRIQARGFNFNPQLLNVDRLASMMPSSSTHRRIHKPLSINNQPHVNGSNNSGSILRRPAPLRAEPKPSQTRALQIKTEPVDAGVDQTSHQVSPDECHSSAINHVQNSPYIELSQKTPELLMLSSAGSSNNMDTPIFVDGDLMGTNLFSGTRNNEWDEYLLEPDVESFFFNDVPDNLSPLKQNQSPMDNIEHQDFQFKEVVSIHPTNNKLVCCDFSTPENFLVAAGHEKKVYILNMRDTTYEAVQGHAQLITGIRFKPNSDIFATSSFDRTIKIWDASNPRKTPWSLVGHAEHVVSLDFHPRKFNFLCSCDSNGEIRFWDVNGATCEHTLKGADRHVRFQPGVANLLAAANGNIINLIDVETGRTQHRFEGHTSDVNSICWDLEGKYIVSASEDSVRVWSIESSAKCVQELHSSGNKFASCTFHPAHSLMVVVGSYQAIDIWNPTAGNRIWKCEEAHEGIVSALSHSSETNTIASVSHDQWIKLWK